MKCMFKSTITLPNGAIVHVECETAVQLAGVLSMELGVVNSVSNADVLQKKAEKMVFAARVYKKGKVFRQDNWSEKDVMLAVNRLIETGAQHGTVGETVKYMQKNGEQQRKEWATYVMVNRIKCYMFDGKTRGTGLSKYVVAILKANGIVAGSSSKSRKTPVGKKKFVHWTDRDIVEVGKIVRNNVGLTKGISNRVKEYVRNRADEKNRGDATLYSVTSDLKLYFLGENSSRITDKMKSVLTKAGVLPVNSGTPVAINRSSNVLQEA